jgi:fructose-1,6-bisphosphatase I
MNKAPTNMIGFYSYVDYPLLSILTAICKSSLKIEQHIRYSGIHGLHGNHPTSDTNSQSNASGDIQKKLDVVANDIMIEDLIHSYACNILLSEENDEPIRVSAKCKGLYSVAFDPLDGSSNIDCNGPIGTIFSISKNEKEEILLPGNRIVMAGYVLYGPSTEMVVAHNNKVNRFQLHSDGHYLHIGPIVLNGLKKIYSINEGNSSLWNADIKQYIESYKQSGYGARYIGSMVADVHRTLLYGGVFCYPADKKNPKGKLRLLYECFPMAFIFEAATGSAIVGDMSCQRILDIVPVSIHQRTPILLGSAAEVKKYNPFLPKANL